MILLMSSVTSLIDADAPLFPAFVWQGDDTFSASGSAELVLSNTGLVSCSGSAAIGVATFAEPENSVIYWQDEITVEVTATGDAMDEPPPVGETVLGTGIIFGFVVPPQSSPLTANINLKFRRLGDDTVRGAKDVVLQSRA